MDRHDSFYTETIGATVRYRTTLRDGLLRYRNGIETEKHYAHPEGYTEQVFWLDSGLGFRSAPRLGSVQDHRIFCFEKRPQVALVNPLLNRRVRSRRLKTTRIIICVW
jgi:TnpA family transposase